MTDTRYDRSTQDVGNLLGLEHVNLVMPDRDIADRFYVSALGFTRDPYADLGLFGTTWFNLGGQQLHIGLGGAPQVFRGVIGLVVPDPDLVAERLERLIGRFEPVAASQAACVAEGDGYLVTGPWGNRFRIHGPDHLAVTSQGLPYVEVTTGPGTAAGIAAFYDQVFGAATHVDDHNGMPRAVVDVGRSQHLYFVETEQPIADYDGHHIAVYLHNFSRPYDWLLERELITMEANDHEYRFVEIVDPESGQVCAELEHEVRSMYHPMFGRGLVNRHPEQGVGLRHQPGHDVQPGLHSTGVG